MNIPPLVLVHVPFHSCGSTRHSSQISKVGLCTNTPSYRLVSYRSNGSMCHKVSKWFISHFLGAIAKSLRSYYCQSLLSPQYRRYWHSQNSHSQPIFHFLCRYGFPSFRFYHRYYIGGGRDYLVVKAKKKKNSWKHKFAMTWYSVISF